MENKNNKGLDAVDTLLLMGYTIVNDGNGGYRLCAANAQVRTTEDKKLICNILEEVENNMDFYTAKIVELGRRLK